MQKVKVNEIEISEEDWALYILNSPLYLELLEDDIELLQEILK
ncbi:hypothetical protein [Shewanella xiamenensis]|nr:hypothetical protein [Shewanella xiamenensis]